MVLEPPTKVCSMKFGCAVPTYERSWHSAKFFSVKWSLLTYLQKFSPLKVSRYTVFYWSVATYVDDEWPKNIQILRLLAVYLKYKLCQLLPFFNCICMAENGCGSKRISRVWVGSRSCNKILSHDFWVTRFIKVFLNAGDDTYTSCACMLKR